MKRILFAIVVLLGSIDILSDSQAQESAFYKSITGFEQFHLPFEYIFTDRAFVPSRPFEQGIATDRMFCCGAIVILNHSLKRHSLAHLAPRGSMLQIEAVNKVFEPLRKQFINGSQILVFSGGTYGSDRPDNGSQFAEFNADYIQVAVQMYLSKNSLQADVKIFKLASKTEHRSVLALNGEVFTSEQKLPHHLKDQPCSGVLQVEDSY